MPAAKLIPPKSLHKLLELAKKGAPILFYKELPINAPGNSIKRSEWIEFYPVESKFKFVQKGALKKAVIGKGSFIVSNDLNILFSETKARKESYTEKGLSVLNRRSTEGKVYFINNRTDRSFEDWITLNEKPVSVALFNPMTGENGLAKQRKNDKDETELLLQLKPYESVIIQTYKTKKTAKIFPYQNAKGGAQTISGEWTIEFLDGGPTLPARIITEKLYSWSDMDTSVYSNFSGTAKYSISFNKPDDNAANWLLDLGKVHETAEVILNGKKIATLIGPTFQCIISSSLFQQTNKFEIIVANLMANRISYMDRNKLPWKIFYNTNMPARKKENAKNGLFDASAWQPLPSGLLGPVTITPLN